MDNLNSTSGVSFLREDGRSSDQIREMFVEFDILTRADGSCRFKLGETNVLACVYGPSQELFSNKARVSCARIQVVLYKETSLVGSVEHIDLKSRFSTRDLEGESIIEGVYESVIQTHLYPHKVITIAIQIVNDAGSYLSCAILACSGALINAGINLYNVPTAVCCTLKPDDENLLIDPSKEEEINSTRNIFLCTNDKEYNFGILALVIRGIVSRKKLNQWLLVTQKAATTCCYFLRLSYMKKIQKQIFLYDQ